VNLKKDGEIYPRAMRRLFTVCGGNLAAKPPMDKATKVATLATFAIPAMPPCLNPWLSVTFF
jgi:hypothetical protein